MTDLAAIDLSHEPDFVIGSAVVKPSHRVFVANGAEETIEPRVMQVLVALVRRAGEVVSRDDLVAMCWGGRVVGDDAISRPIAMLRKLGETSGAFAIETVPRVGYRLTAKGDIRAAGPAAKRVEIGAAAPAGATSGPAAREAAAFPFAKRRSTLVLVAGGLLAVTLVALFVVTFARGPASAPGSASVAVLPFSDHSEAGDQAHLANGMTVELLSRLRGIDKLTVAGGDWMPEMVKQLGGDPKSLGERLSVATILDGDVRSDGNNLRITARLTRASDSHIVWSESYEREKSGIFALQDEIASAVANALSVTLDVGLQSTSYGGTKNFEAYDHYLRGRALRNVGSPDQPVRELEQAVAIDPNYARAWGELTNAYGQVARLARTPRESEPALQKMDEASKRAEALAPDRWFGHTPRGWYLMAKNDWIGADDAHRRALALGDVADPDLYQTVINMDGQVGRYTHARAMGDRVKSIDPRFRDRYINAMAGNLALRNYEPAWEAYDASVAEKPAYDFLREFYAACLALADRKMDRARHSLKLLAPSNPIYGEIAKSLDSPERLAALAKGVAGTPNAGRRQYSLGAALAGQAGEPELAVDLLRKAYLGPGWAGNFMIWLPELAEARKTESFKTFVRDLGFVDMWRKSGDWGDFCHPTGPDDFECN